MAVLKTIRIYGDQLVAFFDDGTKQMAYPTAVAHVFLVSGTSTGGGGPIDPGTPGAGKMIQPFTPDAYDASDPFGSMSGGRTYPHTGSDYNGLAAGTPIPAISDGVVVRNVFSDGNGNTLTVQPTGVDGSPEFSGDWFWAYLHMQSPALPAVGATVTKGQIVGYLGNTGYNSQGAHLHITISDSANANLGQGNKVDPHALIAARV